MRIAIVSDFFLDYIGGAQTSIQEQRQALEDEGHTVFLVSSARLPRGRRIRLRERTLEIKPAWVVPGVILPVVGARRALVAYLAEYLARERVDVVHLQTEFGLAHAMTRAARTLGIPVVHTVHTFYWQTEGWWQGLIAPLLRLGLENVTETRFSRLEFTPRATDNLLRNLTLTMAREADALVSPSDHQARDLAAAGVTAPITVIPNPVARSPRPATLLGEEQLSPPRLLWVARCEPEKRPLVFVEAALEARERSGGAFEVDFVGDGALLAQARRLVHGQPWFRFHGVLDHPAVIDLMDASALVVLTSFGFDNQPMTIAEAISRRRGVLYCDPQLGEGLAHAGHLSATPDAHGLADAIVELVGDPGALRRLSSGAVDDAATFAPRVYVDHITAAYAAARARLAEPAPRS
ncbi:glycosyltransferase family 4 protein [Galbitalea soli]|uniref:Glycosyltransferase family 4 protein n=1 Tax=Galbitalea soli TaxID=1268042 RepID=A0A7C9TQH9_9MICO|nr:glycosyltransferase family 4 protein [Galbitalea soli]NEM90323.1 glycosyltransferase family 4 protein [Galbitalea soli]NYJ31031.1 glycosyltransferase involved in cell wall biosynthesis [Galbitalea soli]